ncbi:lytic murein transglycosylase [Streptomyces sp. 7N604]|uniref:lytic murein transglycosylase n=1 Tax=Streptomyces sp. 7N604 TaxID=3457415 RepID=UPI003FD0ABE9
MAGRYGSRIRRGVTGTAVAAAAMAALTASQAPGVLARASAPDQEVTPPPGPPISGNTPYYTELPPLAAPGNSPAGPNVTTSPGAGAIPSTVLAAYQQAEAELARSHPGCHLPWQLLAAIGQVESAQARGGRVDADGTTHAPILGPQLNGRGFAAISDTDDGVYDGDRSYDRAVGPMQFIPSTWATWGADGNGDGERNPSNIYDAALAAGRYLCADGRDLSDPYDLDRAILGYNHSQEYLRTVKSWFAYFRTGHREVPDAHPAGGRSGPDSPAPRPKPSSTRAKAEPSAPSSPEPDSGRTSPKPSPSRTTDRPDDPEPSKPRVPLPNTEAELPDSDVVPLPTEDAAVPTSASLHP